MARLTLNRPEKRNPLSNALRGELFAALERIDQDPTLRVTILRGAGGHFSAGYDLKQNSAENQPFYTPGGLGNWPRHVVDGFFRMNDLAKPVIAAVEGYCLAGGTELATACDLVYVAEDARIGYPVVRAISPPDNQFFPWVVGLRRAMEPMLTGDAMSGTEAAACGFANRAFPPSSFRMRRWPWRRRSLRCPPMFSSSTSAPCIDSWSSWDSARPSARGRSFRPWPCSGNRPGPICAPFVSRV